MNADDLLRRVLEETDGDYDISGALWNAISEYLDAPKKPMTEEEILDVARDHYNPHQRAEISFARAIERHHGIGGEE